MFMEEVIFRVEIERPGHTFDMRLPLRPVKDHNERS